MLFISSIFFMEGLEADINSDEDIFFDRNVVKTTDTVNRSEVITEPTDAKQRATQYLNHLIASGQHLQLSDSQIGFTEISLLNADILEVGELHGKMLTVILPPSFNIVIDISLAIEKAIRAGLDHLILSMINLEYDLHEIQPKIMIMCAEANRFELLDKLIDEGIPIDGNNYATMYYLAAKGKHVLIQKILNQYGFLNITEIIGKMCVQACMNNQVSVLEILCPQNSLGSVPDIAMAYFLNSIRFGHIPILKYFIDGGVTLAQNNYIAVEIAKQYRMNTVLESFTTVDPKVNSMLNPPKKSITTEHNKEISKMEPVCKELPTGTKCCIMLDVIEEGTTYYECEMEGLNRITGENLTHHYQGEGWENWVNGVEYWRCMLCKMDVKQICYVNRDIC